MTASDPALVPTGTLRRRIAGSWMATSTTSVRAGDQALTRARKMATPRLLGAIAGVLAVGMLALGVGGVAVASSRLRAARHAGLEAAALVEDAQQLYVRLADADAAASAAFLEQGSDPVELRERYLRDLRDAAHHLAAITAAVDPSTRDAVARIDENLLTYRGRIDAARVYSSLGLPVGAAYLRQASELMRRSILPEASRIYRQAAGRLHDDFAAATSAGQLRALAAGAGAGLLALAVGQTLVTARSRRIINVGLAGATVLTVLGAAVVAVSLVREQDALVSAQQSGSDGLIVLSTSRIVLLQAMSDENLNVIERGTDDSRMEDFDKLLRRLGDEDDGLLGDATAIARITGSEDRLGDIVDRFDDFVEYHQQVRDRVARSDYVRAIQVIHQETEAAADIDELVAAEIEASGERLDAHARRARDVLAGVPAGIGLASAGAALLLLLGLQARLREYR